MSLIRAENAKDYRNCNWKKSSKKIGDERQDNHSQFTTMFSYFIMSTSQSRISVAMAVT